MTSDHLSNEEQLKKITEAEKLVKVGGKYRHYKGNEYRVIKIVLHSETLEEMVIYEPLYEAAKVWWARPLKLFAGEIEYNGKKMSRFEFVGN